MKNKIIDHSLTYKFNNIFKLPHIIRLNRIKNIFSKIQKINNYNSFLDIGCSNGYITNLLSKNKKFTYVLGLDHNIENIKIAKTLYPNINFDFFNLNIINEYKNVEKFDIITCFETLEHVGSINNAIQNLIKFKKDKNSIIIISVPIEIGLIGIFKYFLKIFKSYKLDELEGHPSNFQYLFSLLKGDISKFRDNRDGWGTHFGFDYRKIDNFLITNYIKYSSTNSFTTRFYFI
jgi:2-polyprenyl-3-methyl-5-hydroxy-6-metoxy-1,4-benzoquinol methylase